MAEYGFRARDAVGRVQVTLTTSLSRKIGEIYTGVSDGAISVPEFVGRIPYYFLAPSDTNYLTQRPVVTISGTTLSWSFSDVGNGARSNCRLVYGIVG